MPGIFPSPQSCAWQRLGAAAFNPFLPSVPEYSLHTWTPLLTFCAPATALHTDSWHMGGGGCQNSVSYGQYDSSSLPLRKEISKCPHPRPRQDQQKQQCCSTDATRPPDPTSARKPPVTLNGASVARLLVKSPCVVAPGSSEVFDTRSPFMPGWPSSAAQASPAP